MSDHIHVEMYVVDHHVLKNNFQHLFISSIFQLFSQIF